MTPLIVWFAGLFATNPANWAITDWVVFGVLTLLSLIFIFGLFGILKKWLSYLRVGKQKIKVSKHQSDTIKFGKGITTFSVISKTGETKTGFLINDADKVWYWNKEKRHLVFVNLKDASIFENNPNWERIKIDLGETKNEKL